MSFETLVASPGGAIAALSGAIADLKDGDRLRPTTVIVPTNVSGVMARRALGRGHGIIGVDMLTLNRLAELLAGPSLAAQQRQPVSAPVLELTVRAVLDEAPGSFAPVADHPATVEALRSVHAEIRLAGDDARALDRTSRGREARRVSTAVTRRLASQWYDEADLYRLATELLADPLPDELQRVVLYLPGRLDALAVDFTRRLGELADVRVLTVLTGDETADAPVRALLDRLGAPLPDPTVASPESSPADDDPPGAPEARPARIVSTTDADDEVVVAVRAVVDAARGASTGAPVPFERIAVLWPTQRPYARLVEHHLDAAGIPWNGRGGTELTERLAPRLLLDLLDVDRRGLRRRSLFSLLADVPGRDADGRPWNTAAWERVSRAAGVSDDEDWAPRLGALHDDERWGASARELSDFVSSLRSDLGHPLATRSWRDWVDWCVERLDAWLGRSAIGRLSDAEYRGWEALMSALERLRSLDLVGEPPTRQGFRAVLESELADSGVRQGRIGTGVTIGSLAAAAGLDVDVAVVVGAAEGLLPPTPRADPLLGDADRERAGLARSDERAVRLHHEYLSLVAGAHTIVTFPRGDLRSTTSNQPSRHLDVSASGVRERIEVIESATKGLGDVVFAPSDRERRLGDLLRARREGRPESVADLTDLDPPMGSRLSMRSARLGPSLTAFDGDLSGSDVPSPIERAVSPTRIEAWSACPHGYFVRYVLGVQPIEEPDAEVTIRALDRGLVHHQALDLFHHDVIDGRLPQPTTTGWTDEHRAALLAHFDRVCADFERAGRTGRPATWAVQRETMRDDLLGWLEKDGEYCRARGVTVLASEHRFPDGLGEGVESVSVPLPDGRRVRLQGSVDRLDRCADGTLVITDHKTGGADKFKKIEASDPTLAGTVFQLPAYAAAALARFGEEPGSAATPVRSEYSMFSKGNYRRIGYEFSDEVWEAASASLAEVVEGIESGWFPQHPERPGFRMFVACRYCDPDGLGTSDAFTAWQRKRQDERIARWFGADDERDVENDD